MDKKAFTLIELLAVILILSAIVLIVAPLVVNQINQGRVALSDQTRKNIVMSATNWANDNKKYLPEDGEEGAIWVGILQGEGYLEDDITDPSGENINSGCVVISNHDGAYYYEYRSGDDDICSSASIKKRVVFNATANGGKLLDGKDIAYYYPGESIDLPMAEKNVSGEQPFNFVGWNLSQNAHSGIHPNTGTMVMADDNMTLYAIYVQPKKDYVVKFEGNGGTGSAPKPSTCTIEAVYNNEKPLQKDYCEIELPTNTFTKDRYKFNGWNTNINAGSGIAAGTRVKIYNDTTYYAIWKKNFYTVTYNYSYNGGTSSSVTSKTVEVGNKVDLTPTAYKSGWTFVGWNTSSSATTALSSYPMPEKNVTLYAIYKKPSKSYRITTNANGGSGTARTSSCTIPAVYNNATQKTSCTAILPSNGFSRSGYSFNGWSTNRSASSGYSSGTSVSLSSNRTYYATWKKNVTTKTYTVNFYSNNRRYSTKTCTTTGSSCYVTTPAAPTGSSYKPNTNSTFRFWGTSTSSSTGKAANSSISVSGNKSYYAVWKTSSTGGGSGSDSGGKTYTATFMSNGRKVGTESCTTTGTKLACSVKALNAPTGIYKPSDAISFNGWSFSSTASSGVKPGGSIALSSDRTLYATWSKSVPDTMRPKVWLGIYGDDILVASGNNGTITAPGTYNKVTIQVAIADFVNGSDASDGYGSGFYNGNFTMGFEGGSQTRTGTLKNNGTRIDGEIIVTTTGNRTVSVTVTDKAGNTGTATAKFTLSDPIIYACRDGQTMVYDTPNPSSQYASVWKTTPLKKISESGEFYYVQLQGGWYTENPWYDSWMFNNGYGYIYKKCTRNSGQGFCSWSQCPG